MTGLLQPGTAADPSVRPDLPPPTGASPDGGGPPPKRPRKAVHRVLLGVNIALATLVVLVAAGVGYIAVQEHRIHRIKISGGEGGAITNVAKGQPTNILLVGSDSRAFAKSKADQKAFGSQADVGDGQRSDTMMVIRLDPKNDRATVMSIARDLYVDLEGGGKGRINEAFQKKGDPKTEDPGRLIRTITANFGVPINHYIEVDFAGFRQVVDAIGGVNVYFPSPARDAFSDLNIAQTGCVQLNGPQALSYVRARHFEYQVNGRWKTDPTGDFGRITRQQDFMRRVLHKAVRDGLTNPVKSFQLIEAGIANVKLDPNLGLGDMKSLASQMKGLDEGHVQFLALTGDPVTIGGADVLRVNHSQADSILAAFGANVAPAATATGATTPTGIPGGTTVVAYNGSGKAGVVADAVAQLDQLGVSAGSGGNGVATDKSTVRYRAGGEVAARAVLPYVGGGATLVVDRTVKAGQVVVVLGRSFTGVVDPKAAPAATTTTAPLSTPTTPPAKGSDPSQAC